VSPVRPTDILSGDGFGLGPEQIIVGIQTGNGGIRVVDRNQARANVVAESDPGSDLIVLLSRYVD
jgi:hypothetical protein